MTYSWLFVYKKRCLFKKEGKTKKANSLL